MERTNLHSALNLAHNECPGDYPVARDLVSGGYPELIQVRDEEGGKTYLYCLCYGEGHLVTDITVIDRTTGRMTVIPREEADPDAPYFKGFRPRPVS